MFEGILSPLRTLDAAVQRRVDAVTIALMRRLGVGRAFVRYLATVFAALSSLLVACLPTAAGMNLTGRIFFTWIAATFLGIAEWNRRREAEVENSVVLPSRLIEYPPIFKVLCAWQIGEFAWSLAFGEPSKGVTAAGQQASDLGMLGFNIGFLLMQYVANSPRRPPPSEERETSPAPQSASAEA